MPEPEARLSNDRSMIVMQRGLWRSSFPVAKLPGWLQFYRRLRDRRHRAYARFYLPVVKNLERIERALEADAEVSHLD